MPGDEDPKGFIVAVVRLFLTGPLSVLFLALAALLGLMAVFLTPREEEPQIVVPMADLAVSFPGHSAAEVEQLVPPLERLLWQVDGVEHVYSASRPDAAGAGLAPGALWLEAGGSDRRPGELRIIPVWLVA